MKGYEVCACGTYHSTAAPPPEDIYTPDYWTHERGHSTIHEQVFNVDEHKEGGKTKNEFVLERIEVKDREAALEIGCAPGKLLSLLKSSFLRVVGIESVKDYEGAIREIGEFEDELIFGFFPKCTDGLEAESFNLILALDLFEHIHEPEAFLTESARLLRQGGQLLLMLPLAEEMDDRFWDPVEHVWIFSKLCMEQMLTAVGFSSPSFSLWCLGHSVVSVRKL